MGRPRSLTEEQVLKIRTMREEGATYHYLSQKFNRSTDTIRKLCQGYTYKDVDGPLAQECKAEHKVNRKLTARQVWQCRMAYYTGLMPTHAIADAIKLGHNATVQMLRGENYKDVKMPDCMCTARFGGNLNFDPLCPLAPMHNWKRFRQTTTIAVHRIGKDRQQW